MDGEMDRPLDGILDYFQPETQQRLSNWMEEFELVYPDDFHPGTCTWLRKLFKHRHLLDQILDLFAPRIKLKLEIWIKDIERLGLDDLSPNNQLKLAELMHGGLVDLIYDILSGSSLETRQTIAELVVAIELHGDDLSLDDQQKLKTLTQQDGLLDRILANFSSDTQQTLRRWLEALSLVHADEFSSLSDKWIVKLKQAFRVYKHFTDDLKSDPWQRREVEMTESQLPSVQNLEGEGTEKTIKPALQEFTSEATTLVDEDISALSIEAALDPVDTRKLQTREEIVKEIVGNTMASVSSKQVRERMRQEMEKIKSASKLAFIPQCKENIGSGGFGDVYKEVPPGGVGKPWAVKRIFKQRSPQFGIKRDYIVEEIMTSTLLMQEQSELFVNFFGWCEDTHFVYLAMEYVELSDLEKNLVEPWSEEETKLVMKQLLGGVAIMHNCHITHRDLKPQNIFLVSRVPPRVKIGDFGISKRVPEGSSSRLNTVFETRGYTAPEVTRKKQHTTAVDIWSLACIIYRMIIGELLFKSDIDAVLEYDEIVAGLDDAVAGKLSPDGTKLLKSLLAKDPKGRPTADEALSHTWFL